MAIIVPVLVALGCGERCCTQAPEPNDPACWGATQNPDGAAVAGAKRSEVVIELALLALDLDTCDRCTDTDATIESVVADVRPVLAEVGVELRFRKTVVKTAEQAMALRLETSPTVRLNGRDIPIEFRESRCRDCTTLCGGNADTECRVWVWRGKEYTVAPKGLIIDAILRAYPAIGDGRESSRRPYSLPDNLRRFFEAKERRVTAAGGDWPDSSDESCCDTPTCCPGSEKASCCGNESSTGNTICGCKPR